MYGLMVARFWSPEPIFGAQATQEPEAVYNRVCLGRAATARDPGFQGNAAAWFVHGLQY